MIFGLLEVCHDLLDELPEVDATHVVVGLEEHLPQPRLSDGVVFGIELVEPVESVPVLEMVDKDLVRERRQNNHDT